MTPTITLLLTVLVIAAVIWLCFWMVDNVGLPTPLNFISKAIIAVIGIAYLLTKSGLL